MANDTLSPVGFDRPFIKANVPADMRHALGCVLGRLHSAGETEADVVRFVLASGLDALGWTEERIIREYAEYRVRCLQLGETNAYGKE